MLVIFQYSFVLFFERLAVQSLWSNILSLSLAG